MQSIDIPFEFRNACFFCGEPKSSTVEIEDSYLFDIADDSSTASIPSCRECETYFSKIKYESLEDVVQKVKEQLIKDNQAILTIGAAWTKAELNGAEFTGDLGRFGESAWQAYKIAKERVTFKGWEVTIDSISIGDTASSSLIEYDGMTFQNHSKVFDYIADIYSFNRDYFEQVVIVFGFDFVDSAIKYCLHSPARTPREREIELCELEESLAEETLSRSNI